MLTPLLCGLAAALSLVAAAPAAAPAAEPANEAPEAPAEVHALGWVLAPGDARAHTVELELDSRVAVRTGTEQEVRHTSTAVSYRVSMLGLRCESDDEIVVELVVGAFRLGLTTEAGSSALKVTMDDEGITLRRDGETAQRVPWRNVPRGRGGEVGELVGRPMLCTINRHATAVKIDSRMGPWSQVLDSMDLTTLVVPLVPLPDTEVEPGAKWTVTGTRSVQLSRPWGALDLGTRTEVTLVGFEQHDGAVVARLAFVRTEAPVEERPRFSYELTVEGEMLVRLDGTVVGGEAAVTVTAATAIVASQYELTGSGTLRFDRPQAPAPEEVEPPAPGTPAPQ